MFIYLSSKINIKFYFTIKNKKSPEKFQDFKYTRMKKLFLVNYFKEFTISSNAFGWFIARSARTFLFKSIPAA